jgi:hypothetical protein
MSAIVAPCPSEGGAIVGHGLGAVAEAGELAASASTIAATIAAFRLATHLIARQG